MRQKPVNPTHQVRQGDTLWAIAIHQYGSATAWPDIASANGIKKPYTILVGQVLRLPNLQGATPQPRPSLQVAAPPPARTSTGAVQLGTLAKPGPSAASEAMQPARSVAYPPFEYELDTCPKIEVITPAAKISLKLRGKLTIKRRGALKDLTLSKDAIKLKLGAETDSEFVKLMSGGEIKWTAKTAELKCELAVVSKVAGKEFVTQRIVPVPPATMRYIFEPAPITASDGEFDVKGTFGYEVEITPNRTARDSTLVAVGAPASNGAKWVLVGVGVAGVLAKAIAAIEEAEGLLTFAAFLAL